MRVLVVGHSYVTAFAQSKYVMMKKINPSLKLKILIPKQVPHPFMTYTWERAVGLERDEVAPLSTILPFRSNMSYLFWPQELYTCIKNFRPDVIHVEEEPQALITVQTISLATWAAPRAAICLFIWDNLYRRRRFPLSLIKRQLGTYSLRRCDAIVCGNREAEDLLRSQRGYRGLTVVLPQVGVEPDAHRPGPDPCLREQLGLNGATCLGYIGRLVPEKGVLLLLHALTFLESYPWKLVLVGSGLLEDQIRTQWMQRFHDRIAYIPAVPHRDVPKYLRCLDIFVLPSYATARWKEQFGLVLAQAMMVGVPVVGSSSGAIPQVIGPGGLIFKEGDVRGLSSALEELLASDEERKDLGQRARAFALQHYTTEAVAAGYLSVFEMAYQHAWRI